MEKRYSSGLTKAQRLRANETWECRARPAALGSTCGAINTPATVISYQGRIECCGTCGCTRVASDDRAKREAAAKR